MSSFLMLGRLIVRKGPKECANWKSNDENLYRKLDNKILMFNLRGKQYTNSKRFSHLNCTGLGRKVVDRILLSEDRCPFDIYL